MELRTVVATVESGEQDAVLKVLQIYNQEVSEHHTSACCHLLLPASLEAGWPCYGIAVLPSCPQFVSSEHLPLYYVPGDVTDCFVLLLAGCFLLDALLGSS